MMKKKQQRSLKGSSGNSDRKLREQLVHLLKGGGAHVHFDDALNGLPVNKRGAFAKGLPHTLWQLLEHMRLAQWDILEFSRDPEHISPGFPQGYWPKSPSPASDSAWHEGVSGFKKDLREMIRLVENPRTDLLAPIEHGQGQTILREALLLADHNAYHLGQMIYLRRALHIWPEG
jgi:hypothetical protein